MGDKKKIEEQDLVEAAEAYVAEAMAPYEHLMTPEEKALMAFLLEAELLAAESQSVGTWALASGA